LVERVLGKDEVTGSIPVPGSRSTAEVKGYEVASGRKFLGSGAETSLGDREMSGGNSGVESLPSKQMVAGSNPVPRSIALANRF
jgi:hypothetical protein